MPPIDIAAMIEVDRLMVDEYGITLVQMMEHAGRAVGKGNNGGGGLVAARHLANAGAAVAVALAVSPGDLGPIPEHQRRILARMGIPGSIDATDLAALVGTLAGAVIIVDALIGYRLCGDPRPPIAGFIAAANAATGGRVALDLPSGLGGTSGEPAGPTLRADATVTLAWPKAGLLGAPAAPFVGALYLADIGVPRAVYRSVGIDAGTIFSRGAVVPIRPDGDGWRPLPDRVAGDNGQDE
jgi:NAD(P)H-hydrate epimerase